MISWNREVIGGVTYSGYLSMRGGIWWFEETVGMLRMVHITVIINGDYVPGGLAQCA